MRTGSTGTTNYKSLHCNDSPLSIDPSVSVKARGSKRPEASDRNREATHSIAGTSKYEPTPSFSLRNKASIVATEVATKVAAKIATKVAATKKPAAKTGDLENPYRSGSKCSQVFNLLLKGATVDSIQKDLDTTKKNVLTYLWWVKSKGFVVEPDSEGVYTVKNG